MIFRRSKFKSFILFVHVAVLENDDWPVDYWPASFCLYFTEMIVVCLWHHLWMFCVWIRAHVGSSWLIVTLVVMVVEKRAGLCEQWVGAPMTHESGEASTWPPGLQGLKSFSPPLLHTPQG
jgi:hypothetical protein